MAALTPLGPFTSPDSADIVAAARSVARLEGYRRSTGEAYALWPPLLPALLAAAERAGFDAIAAARFSNAICFGALAATTGALIHTLLPWRTAALGGAASVLVSWPVLQPALWLWSEPLFCLLVVLFLLTLGRWCERPTSTRLAAITVLAALACLQRYLGVALVAAGAGAILVTLRPRRLRAAVTFSVGALAPLAVWIARNLAVTGTATGHRSPSRLTACEALTGPGAVIASWTLPWSEPSLEACRPWLPTALLVLAVAMAARWVRGPRRPAPAACAFVFVGTSVAVITAASLSSRLDPPERMMAPLFVPALLLAVAGLRHAVEAGAAFASRPLASGIAVAAALVWILGQAERTIDQAAAISRTGRMGFTSREWQQSPLITLARLRAGTEPVLSNYPAPASLWLGRPVARALRREDWLPSLVEREGAVQLLWFQHAGLPPHEYDPADLAPAWVIAEVARARDGALVRLVRKE